MTTETIKTEYEGYTGYAYGASSFSLRDSSHREIFHTGFCTKRPQNEEECLEFTKRTLKLLHILREAEHDE